LNISVTVQLQTKERIRRVCSRLGYNIGRDAASGRYTLTRRRTLGSNYLADIKRILLKSPGCIFDVGAHEGDSAVTFLEAFPTATIYSFEPDPDTYNRLQENLKHKRQVHPVNSALGHHDGTQLFFRNRSDQTNSLLSAAPTAREFLTSNDLMDLRSTTTVAVRTLDSFCRENGISSIDLLKLDTQGYELNVLNGATEVLARLVPLIYLEVSFVSYYDNQPLFPDVYSYLFTRGYRMTQLYETGFQTHNYLVAANALFVHESLGRVTRTHGALPGESDDRRMVWRS